MKIRSSFIRGLWLFALALSSFSTLPEALAQGTTAFTYQGQLRDGGTNANGNYSMVFKLHDALTSGNQVGPTVTLASQFITNGQFNASLDFGAVFEGSARWLEISVEGNLLTPRTPVAPTPYSLYSAKAGSVSNPTFLGTTGNTPLELYVNNTRALRLEPATGSPNLIGGYSGNVVSNGFIGAVIAGGGAATNPENGDPVQNIIGANFAFIGSGARNLITGEGGVIGGGFYNTVTNGTGVIAGGDGNLVGGSQAFIGAGSENVATGHNSVVAGGSGNRATGGNAFIGGGQDNVAGTSSFSVVAGGKSNTASGNQSIVGGGDGNTASGDYSVVIGGLNNTASANFCFAGGTSANATHQGSFVWSSDGSSSFSSAAIGEFAVRAAGGFRFVCGPNSIAMLNNTVTIGNGDFRVPAGGASFRDPITAAAFNTTSDRNAKQDFAEVNGREVLAKVLALPIQTWAFKQDTAIRHIGPMAQDFRSAFGLGVDEKHIATVDADGVALAAIQGLNEVVKEKDAEIASLKQRLESLEKAVSTLVQTKNGGAR